MDEHVITTFVRTKSVFKHRLKDLKEYDTVKVYVYEMDNLIGRHNHGPLLWNLKTRGEIWYDTDGNFRALRRGPINPELLNIAKRKDKVVVTLTPLHLWMREQLRYVQLYRVPKKDIPVYFKAFLDHQKGNLEPFFSVDAFSGRVHTPVVNLKNDLRFKLRFHNSKIVSLDVKQMQPTILAKVLEGAIGENQFSTAIFNGQDVYVLLQKVAQLKERRDAKKYLFQLIFGQPMEGIGKMFQGDRKWVDWINDYKRSPEKNNPHKENMHTNLAWLLQYSEVRVMTDIWNRLKSLDIPFLTIHDEVLCTTVHKDVVYSVMQEELKKHFKKFTINVDKGE